MRSGIIIFLFAFMTSGGAFAQNIQTLTLEEAIEIALENSFQLKQAENNLDVANFQETSALADFFPSVTSSVSRNRRIGRQFNNTTGEFGDFILNSYSANANLNVTVFNGFANINSLRSSRLDKQSQKENVQWVRENVIFETASRFLQVLLDAQLLEIARENLEASKQQLEQVRVQVEVGSRPTVDLYNQEATVANNELQVTNRENNLQFSRLRLIRQLQVDPLKEYEFTTPEINEEQTIPYDYDLQQLVTAAMENRSDLQSEKYTIEAIGYQLKATKASLYPSLSFGANISSGFNDQTFEPGTEDVVAFNDQFFDQNLNRSFGFTLNIPIFNNLNRRMNVRNQQLNYRNALLSLENTELQVVQEVTQAYNDYSSVLKQMEASRKALTAAERSYQTERERYEVGASTLIELSTANAQYVEAQSNYAQALYNLVFQQKLLDYYVGKLNADISFD